MSIEHPELHTTNVSPDMLPDHVERVDEAFDNTSLPQAHAEGLVDNQVPDHAQDLIEMASPETANFLERPVTIPEVKPLKRRGLIIGASATVAAGLLAAGAVFGIKAATDQPKNAAPAPGPDAPSSAPLTPRAAETQKAPEKELTVADFEIPAGLTPKQFAEAFVGINGTRNKWDKSLANDKVMDGWIKSGGSDAYMAKVSTPVAKIAAEGMFGPGWEKNPSQTDTVKTFQRASEIEALYYFHTVGLLHPEDKEPWESHLEAVDGKELDRWAEGRRLALTAKISNNAAMNVIGTEHPATLTENGKQFTWTIQTKFVGGKEYITGWTDNSDKFAG